MFDELLKQVKFSRKQALRESGFRREYWFENARRLLAVAREVKAAG